MKDITKEIIKKIGAKNFKDKDNIILKIIDKTKILKHVDVRENINRFYFDIAVDDNKKISYYTEKKIKLFNSNNIFFSTYWKKDVRRDYAIMAKPGKFFRWMFPNISDETIKQMVSLYLSEIPDNKKEFSLYQDIEGIYLAYNTNKYQQPSNNSSLWKSCINDKQECLKFYEYFDVDILVLKKNGKEIGRALVWNKVYCQEKDMNITLMDRVYTYNENDEKLFFKYAIKKEWYRKLKQTYNNKKDVISPAGNTHNYNLSIPLVSRLYCSNFPYLDTFTYCSTKALHNSLSNLEKYLEFDKTSGDYTNNGLLIEDGYIVKSVYVEEDDKYYSIRDCVKIDGYWYRKESISICYVKEDDEYYLAENCVEIDDDFYHEDSSSICYVEEYYEYYLTEDCVKVGEDWYHEESISICYVKEDDKYYLTEDCVEIDGYWYHKRSFSICYVVEDYKYYLTEDCVEIDGYWYHRDSDSICYVVEDYKYYLIDYCVEIDGYWYHRDSDSICYVEREDEYVLKENKGK